MNDTYHTLILGGGLSGLTVAHKLKLHAPKHKFCILEKSNHTGGVIKTHRENGFITEIGPHGFLDNCEESKRILQETGLDQETVKAPLMDFVRYVYLNDKLNLIPQTPRKILMAPLIPWQAKLRVLTELWKPVLQGEPTVAKWINHRFGSALLPYVDAVFTGTYAGDFDKLTIDSVMPGVRALEKEHGSVLRGLISTMRKKKKEGGPKLAMPAMTSFPKGMVRLVERLAENLDPASELQLNCGVTAVTKTATGWEVIAGGSQYKAQNIVCCLPINAALKLLQGVDSTIPQKSVPEARILSVVFGFTNDVVIPPGFGFLIPEKEQRFTLGALFSSNMFPGRAPKDHVVFEALVGGRRHPEKLELDAETLTRKALKDMQHILGIDKEPVYTTILRSAGGIPQLERNYPELLKWQQSAQEQDPSLFISGFGWGGIGLNDMMKSGTRIAEALLNSSGKKYGAELKGVYF
ncbi:MAG: protoporphyrinogen oxidase [Desulfotalea sp.]|nr:MAG: protoporphyrinogen oxidase [Desulfotalea sp.]